MFSSTEWSFQPYRKLESSLSEIVRKLNAVSATSPGRASRLPHPGGDNAQAVLPKRLPGCSNAGFPPFKGGSSGDVVRCQYVGASSVPSRPSELDEEGGVRA